MRKNRLLFLIMITTLVSCNNPNISTNNISNSQSSCIIEEINSSTSSIEEIADQIEAIFNAANMPGAEVLPTFYRISRKPIDDEDKTLIRRQLKFQIQSYEIGG